MGTPRRGVPTSKLDESALEILFGGRQSCRAGSQNNTSEARPLMVLNSHRSDGRVRFARPAGFHVACESSQEVGIVFDSHREVIPMVRKPNVPSVIESSSGRNGERAAAWVVGGQRIGAILRDFHDTRGRAFI